MRERRIITVMPPMLGKLAPLRLREWRYLKPGTEKRLLTRQSAGEGAGAATAGEGGGTVTPDEDYSLTFVSAAEARFGMQVGEQLLRTHGPSRCAGRSCCIHNPSPHHMREWPLNFRFDRGIAERMCEHGCGHPDPDDAAYRRTLPGEFDDGTHGCCGCCAKPATATG